MIEKLIVLDLENDLYWYSYFLSAELIENNSNAISFAKKIIEKQPYCLLAWFYLGLFYQKQEDHLNAIEAFDYAILIDQEYTRTYSYKAESLAEIGHFQKAIDCCLESIEFEEPNCNTYFEIGEYYEKLDKLDKALAYFYKSLRKDNLFADAWYSIALILDFQGNHLESLYHIKQALENNKTNIDYLFLYAEVHEKVGFMKEAQIAYKKVLEIDNLDQESWLNYSNILYQQESTQDAIDALYNAIEYNPNNAKIYFRLSAYLIETGDKTKGLNLFKHALTINYDLHAELFQYMPKIKDNKDLINLLNNFKNEF
jgi:tetratricopeptide (TPR) repeat protein